MALSTARKMDGSSVGPDEEPWTPPLDFSELYAAWFRNVHNWARSLGGPTADPEDITQEVFIVVRRKLDRFDGENLSGWLYRITARTVSDYRRRSWLRRLVFRERDIDVDEIRSSVDGPAELLERKQDRQRFYELVARMNPRWRESFLLFEVAGHSGAEIADLLGLPPATVRTHLHRARQQFVALLHKEEQR